MLPHICPPFPSLLRRHNSLARCFEGKITLETVCLVWFIGLVSWLGEKRGVAGLAVIQQVEWSVSLG